MPTSISISNQSFESSSGGNDTWGDILGWVLDGSSTGGIYTASSGDIGNISGGRVGYIGQDAGDSASQILSETYDAGREYEFSVDVGDADYYDSIGYEINLYAGVTLIGTVSGNTGDTDTLFTVTLTSTVFNPALNGQNLQIQIEQTTQGDYLYFDDVQGSYETLAPDVDGTAGADTMGAGFIDAQGDEIDGSDGDSENVYGYAGNDTIDAGAGDDTIDGGDDADLIQLSDGFGTDVIDGGSGGTDDDTLDASALTSGVTVVMSGDEAGTLTVGGNTATFSDIENLTLTDQDDSLDAVESTDGVNVDGGDGNDTIEGGTGNDTIDGGADNDTIQGGEGDDTILGGLGDDVLTGDTPEQPLQPLGDTFEYSYAQNINGNTAFHFGEFGTGNEDDPALLLDDDLSTEMKVHKDDILEMSFGQTLTAGTSISLLEGSGSEDGNVAVYVSFGSTDPNGDALSGSGGGTGYDNAVTNGQSVLVYQGPSDADVVFILPQDATHIQFVGQSTHGGWAEMELTDILGGGTPVIGTYDDSISGGDGNDSIDGVQGDDTLTGGADNDTFIYNVGDGADTITDFNAGNTGTLNDGDNTNNDFIDLSARYDHLFELWADQNDDSILNQSNTLDVAGNAVDYSDNDEFGTGESITFTGATGNNSFFTVENTGVVCFASGTMIETPNGPRCVETLKAGDEVTTVDNGPQTIRWIHEDPQAIEGGENHPILIKAGALGVNKPAQDLTVSPQHRILVGEAGQLEDLFDTPVLVPAKSLTTLPGIREMRGKKEIVWWHFACDNHEVVIASGAKAENLLLGKMVFKGLPKPQKDELLMIFGTDMAHEGALNGKTARNLLGSGRVARVLKGKKKASVFVSEEVAENKVNRLCFTNCFSVGLPLTPDGFMLRPRYVECQAL